MSKAKDLKVGDCIKHGNDEFIVLTSVNGLGFIFVKYKNKDKITSIHESCEVDYIGSGKITYEYAISIKDACTELYRMINSITNFWYAIKHDKSCITVFVSDMLIESSISNINTWKGYPVKYVRTNNRLVN